MTHHDEIMLFLKDRDPEKLPEPCGDWGCGFCNNWYSTKINERHVARDKRKAELGEAA